MYIIEKYYEYIVLLAVKKRINITIGRIQKNINIKMTVENKSILSETTQVTYNGYHITFEIPEKLICPLKNYLPKDTFKMQSIYNQFINYTLVSL